MKRSVRKVEVVDCPLAAGDLGRELEICVRCSFYRDLTLKGVDCEYKAKGEK